MNDVSAAILAVTVLLLLLLGAIILFFLWYQKKRELNNAKIQEMRLRSEQLEIQFQQTLLQSQLEIQEQTLKNISQEIHDNVGQVLSLAKLNLNLAEVSNPEQARSKINNALSQVGKAINDLRDLSKSLNTDNIIAQGLVKAIAAELDMIGRAGSHKTTFRITGNSRQLEPQKELILFRIVQEALHNIIKHAGAFSVTVTATYTDKQLELCVNDDGRGFDLTPLNENGNSSFGLGIRNMHNRARLIGADFSMNSIMGKGSVVKIVLPFINHETENYART